MINTIFFDVGGVILDLKGPFMNLISFIKPKDPKGFWQEFNLLAVPACQGKESFNDFLRKIGKKFGIEISDKIIDSLWLKDYSNKIKLHHDVIDLIKKLKQNGYKLGVISNTIKELSEIPESDPIRMVGEGIFDVVVLSHEIGIAKPQKEIFDYALKKIGSRPEECIFIDDVKKYVDVANSLGIHGILFKDAKDLEERFENLDISTKAI